MTKEILTDACFIDYIEVESRNVTESTVGEVTTASITDDNGNPYVVDWGIKFFCRDNLTWYSSNGDGTARKLLDMG